jgi:hypothetical protein
VDPAAREAALVKAHLEVQAFVRGHPGFQARKNAQHAPTEYVFRFECPGWAPSPIPTRPTPIDKHEVYVVIPAEYPVKAPDVFWQTPIFHPNIVTKTGYVCLGDLKDRYRPGLSFADLCQMLIDLAAYRNYSLIEKLVGAEGPWDWAASDEGQTAIAGRGGISLISRARAALAPALKLEIERVIR